jgi:hypothetical protein
VTCTEKGVRNSYRPMTANSTNEFLPCVLFCKNVDIIRSSNDEISDLNCTLTELTEDVAPAVEFS